MPATFPSVGMAAPVMLYVVGGQEDDQRHFFGRCNVLERRLARRQAVKGPGVTHRSAPFFHHLGLMWDWDRWR